MPVDLKSRLAVAPAFGLIKGWCSAPGRIDCSLEYLATLRSALSPAPVHEKPEHDRKGNDRDYRRFGDVHDRLLILVIGGRSGGTIVRRRAAKCDLAHTYARKFWERLLADEQRNRSVGFSLR